MSAIVVTLRSYLRLPSRAVTPFSTHTNALRLSYEKSRPALAALQNSSTSRPHPIVFGMSENFQQQLPASWLWQSRTQASTRLLSTTPSVREKHVESKPTNFESKVLYLSLAWSLSGAGFHLVRTKRMCTSTLPSEHKLTSNSCALSNRLWHVRLVRLAGDVVPVLLQAHPGLNIQNFMDFIVPYLDLGLPFDAAFRVYLGLQLQYKPFHFGTSPLQMHLDSHPTLPKFLTLDDKTKKDLLPKNGQIDLFGVGTRDSYDRLMEKTKVIWKSEKFQEPDDKHLLVGEVKLSSDRLVSDARPPTHPNTKSKLQNQLDRMNDVANLLPDTTTIMVIVVNGSKKKAAELADKSDLKQMLNPYNICILHVPFTTVEVMQELEDSVEELKAESKKTQVQIAQLQGKVDKIPDLERLVENLQSQLNQRNTRG